jgi:hypothetical protein
LFGVYFCLKKKSTTALLFIFWLILAVILTQPLYTDKWWVPRLEVMSYPLMILLSSFGFFVLLSYTKGNYAIIRGIMFSVIIFEIIFMYAVGIKVGPIISENEYAFFTDMKSGLPQNTVMIDGYGEYYESPLEYWLIWSGFTIKSKENLAEGDIPFVILESSINESKNVSADKIIGECGRYKIVRY